MSTALLYMVVIPIILYLTIRFLMIIYEKITNFIRKRRSKKNKAEALDMTVYFAILLVLVFVPFFFFNVISYITAEDDPSDYTFQGKHEFKYSHIYSDRVRYKGGDDFRTYYKPLYKGKILDKEYSYTQETRFYSESEAVAYSKKTPKISMNAYLSKKNEVIFFETNMTLEEYLETDEISRSVFLIFNFICFIFSIGNFIDRRKDIPIEVKKLQKKFFSSSTSNTA